MDGWLYKFGLICQPACVEPNWNVSILLNEKLCFKCREVSHYEAVSYLSPKIRDNYCFCKMPLIMAHKMPDCKELLCEDCVLQTSQHKIKLLGKQ